MIEDVTIVGIDPGTTSAVAVLDREGNLLGYRSQKNFSRSKIIEFIISKGRPLIVSTDVSNSPALVEKIASNTGCILHVPGSDLESDYKDRLAGDFDIDDSDSHIEDAVAAAEYARRNYEESLENIAEKFESSGLETGMHEVMKRVLKEGLSFDAVVDDLGEGGEEEREKESSPTNWKKVAERREREIRLLRDKIRNLEEYVERLEERGESSIEGDSEAELRLRNRVIRELRSDIYSKDSRLERLEEEREDLIRAVEMMGEDGVFVPGVESLDDVSSTTAYLRNYRGEDIDPSLETVVVEERAGKLEDRGLKVVEVDELEEYVELEEGIVTRGEELEEKAENPVKFTEWLESYRER